MINKRIWMAASLLIAFLLLAGCGASDEDMLVGTWQLSNIEAVLAAEEIDISEFEEYMQLDLALVFNADGEISFELSILLDFEAMIADSMGDLGLEIEVESLDVQVSMGGTYEIDSPGVLLIRFDADNLTTTPEEVCFTVAGFENCQNVEEVLGEITGEFEDIFTSENDTAFFEVDETSLTIWDDNCDYPEDQECAAHFTK